MKLHHRNALAVLAIAFGLSIAMAPAHAGQVALAPAAPWTQKAPDGVMQKLAQGAPQDLIVLFDDTTVQQEAETLRRRLGVKTHISAVQTLKAAGFKALKQTALGALPAAQHEMLADYSHLPMAFVRFHTAANLQALLQRGDVVAVYRDEKKFPVLAQSLPLINQPAVVSAGDTGLGTTVEIIDSGVNYTLPAFGSCTAPGAPASCKVIFYQNIADSSASLDTLGHGSQVSAIVVGTATATNIAMMNVFGANSSTTDSLVLSAINWGIANQATANIVAMNLSLGDNINHSTPCSNAATNPYVNAIASAKAAGIVATIASGNNGFTNGISSPACTPGAMSVGATYDANVGGITYSSVPCTDSTTAADKVTCFSNSATYLTMLAPGAIITTSVSSGAGTSYAAPFIAAAVAVLRSAFYPETPDQTIARMTSTGVPVTDSRNGIVTPRINLLSAARPSNDQFVNRISLTGNTGAAIGYNVLATKESGEPFHAGNGGGVSVWWKWVSPGEGQVSVDTHTSAFDTLLAVYTGSAVNSLTAIAANDNDGSINNTSGLFFQAHTGVEYEIAVDGFNGASGDIALHWNFNALASANLSVTGSGSPPTVTQGDNITYTLNIQNAGPQTATNVVLTDTLPATTTLVSSSVACSQGGATLTCALGTLLSAGSTGMTVTVKTSAAGSISNTISVKSDVPDPNTTNNSVSISSTVNALPPVIANNDIPTLPEWGAIMMASLLLSVAAWRQRGVPV